MALVKKYRSTVLTAEQAFHGIFTASFKTQEKPFRYKPGQFLHLALDEYDPSAPWPDSRCFSMQTCDSEELIKITYSVKGAFTARMSAELKPGKNVWLKLPYGELFTKPHPKDNAVFIAGGTGITPFLSLFTSGMFAFYRDPRLYLGVRSMDFHIYGKELNTACTINPSFGYFIIDQESKGMLDIKSILSGNGNASMFFISGPEDMIKKFKEFLIANNIREESVRSDDWE